jgi:ABC-2 type transport system permease protein
MPPVNALLTKARFQLRGTRRLIARQSRFKLLFILGFAIGFEALLCLVFYDAFRFLNSFGGAGLLMIGRLFALFFLGLGMMLSVSGIVTSYSTLFGSDEIPFLLVRPFPMSTITLYKSFQAAGYASWAFFFIVLPFISAYALHQHMSLLFILWTLLFSMPFLFVFAGTGSLIILLAVRWFPRQPRLRNALLAAGGILLVILLFLADPPANSLSDDQFNISTLIPGLRLAAHPLSPSYWIAEGITSLTHGAVSRGLLFFSALLSTAMMIGVLIERIGAHLFYDAWLRSSSSAARTRRRPVLLVMLSRLRTLLPSDVAAIIIKDIRTFFRDPAQWSQAVVFFGLLALYFMNLRRFNYNLLPDQWRSAIVFLNVFAVSAVLSSLGSRFVYPQLSLEGHSFWMLVLSPATMPRIIASKFLLAFTATATVSVSLIAVSVNMLGTGVLINIVAIAVIAAVSLSVCGLSTGLGAVFIDLEERNPAAIVSSFGGTLNIVLCLGYILAVILPFGILFHLREAQMLGPGSFRSGFWIASAWLALLTIMATALPLILGLRGLYKRIPVNPSKI